MYIYINFMNSKVNYYIYLLMIVDEKKEIVNIVVKELIRYLWNQIFRRWMQMIFL